MAAPETRDSDRTEFALPAVNASPLDSWGFGPWLRESAQRGDLIDPPDLDTVNDAEVTSAGRSLVNLSGIGVLGWQHDPDVRACFQSAAQRYGLVVGGSRMMQGVARPHVELESQLAAITGRPCALTFATGLLANVGFVNAMTMRFSFHSGLGVDNADTVFVLDRDSHWSMWKAVERLQPGRSLFTFRHNDIAHLRTVLSRLKGRRTVVGFETVYSADGSVAPVGDIQDLCDEFGAVSFADDANGFMMYGDGERRFAAEYADLRRVDVLMLSFGKAVGLGGGALVGPADAIHAFRYLSGTSVFTTNIQPPTASAISYVLQRMRDDPTVAGR